MPKWTVTSIGQFSPTFHDAQGVLRFGYPKTIEIKLESGVSTIHVRTKLHEHEGTLSVTEILEREGVSVDLDVSASALP